MNTAYCVYIRVNSFVTFSRHISKIRFVFKTTIHMKNILEVWHWKQLATLDGFRIQKLTIVGNDEILVIHIPRTSWRRSLYLKNPFPAVWVPFQAVSRQSSMIKFTLLLLFYILQTKNNLTVFAPITQSG